MNAAFFIPPELALTGPRVRLRPLHASDGAALVRAARDGELWRLPFTVVPSAETVGDYMGRALAERDEGSAVPFTTQIAASGEVVGSTRFKHIDRPNRKLEIGNTWIAASWQRTFVNTEVKLVMLRYAFETLGCVRVQFSTDETNPASRTAILRLGAREEGILRNERIMPDGRRRNSVQYSIIEEEWPTVRENLERMVSGVTDDP